MNNEINYTKMLEKAGFTREQSEAQLNILGMVMDQEFAKRSDITKLSNKIDRVEINLIKEIYKIKDDINSVKDDINSVKDDINSVKDDLSGVKDAINTNKTAIEKLSAKMIRNIYIAVGVATGLIGLLLTFLNQTS